MAIDCAASGYPLPRIIWTKANYGQQQLALSSAAAAVAASVAAASNNGIQQTSTSSSATGATGITGSLDWPAMISSVGNKQPIMGQQQQNQLGSWVSYYGKFCKYFCIFITTIIKLQQQ